MGTSVTSTGITFPDATTQSTAATSAFASGTVVLFFQAAAPTGWTKATTYDDYDLRLTTGTGGGTTGGTTAYSTVFANQTPSITVGATTLSTAQLASHNHSFSGGDMGGGGAAYGSSGGGSPSTGYTGGGATHTHSGSSSAITLNVRYANIIACSKN